MIVLCYLYFVMEPRWLCWSLLQTNVNLLKANLHNDNEASFFESNNVCGYGCWSRVSGDWVVQASLLCFHNIFCRLAWIIVVAFFVYKISVPGIIFWGIVSKSSKHFCRFARHSNSVNCLK